jgi:acyl-CoA hydrolase
MSNSKKKQWQKKLSTPDKALALIEPGKNIFIGTGPAEPRSLVKRLMTSEALNLQDLTLIQILSFGEAISLEALKSNKYRLKTFFSGWVAAEAIAAGRVDLIHSRFSTIPLLIKNRLLPIDVAIIQITPPDENGLCSLGLTVDVTRRVMERAQVVMGEINRQLPCTYGDTFVQADSFDVLVESTEPVQVYAPFPVDAVFDHLAANVASVIEDGSCLAFTLNPLFEALPKYLSTKKDLGIHSPFMSDPLMKLIQSGAVTNRRKKHFWENPLPVTPWGLRNC